MITELTLRLHGLPERPVAIRAIPGRRLRLLPAGLRRRRSTVTRCELLDEATLRAVNAYKGTSYEEAPSLFVELDGGDEEVASTREVCGWENDRLRGSDGGRGAHAVVGREAQRRVRGRRGRSGQALVRDGRLRPALGPP